MSLKEKNRKEISESTQEIIEKYGKNEKDTGSSAVQIALLTKSINYLRKYHFGERGHNKDLHSKRGLLRQVNRRQKLLKYMRKKDPNGYHVLIAELGLRR